MYAPLADISKGIVWVYKMTQTEESLFIMLGFEHI